MFFLNVPVMTRNIRSLEAFFRTALVNQISSKSTLSYRTHTCGELRAAHDGLQVTLCGWLQFNRGNFFTLRDSFGVVQVMSNDSTLIGAIPLESVLKVEGKVQLRPTNAANYKMETGEIEIIPETINVIGKCKSDLPFQLKNVSKVNEILRLKYRYLDLRQSVLQNNLRFRSSFTLKIREFLTSKHGFVDVETPTLFKRTPGGAQEFLVPTKQKGQFYSLTQSPQQFKQLLMVGALDRYFQIARCYRDEVTRRNRQPEFTQLDLEMSFSTADSIMWLIEELLKSVWPKTHEIKGPFPKLTYQEAILQYGSDKPDLRHGSKIQNITSLIRKSTCEFLMSKLEDENDSCQVLVLDKNDISENVKKDMKEPNRFAADEKYFDIEIRNDLSWKSSIKNKVTQQVQANINEHLGVKPGQVLYLTCGENHKACHTLGKIRSIVCKFLKFPKSYNFLWITDFPLFELSARSIQSVHHPFTAPHDDDVAILRENPLKVRGQHYDLVLNGQEVGGGSVRINDAELQTYILQNILKENIDELQYFMDALESGCPPHAGIALGLDRLISIICDAPSIRDVIAFPKSYDGKDPMSGAPSSISKNDLATYFL